MYRTARHPASASVGGVGSPGRRAPLWLALAVCLALSAPPRRGHSPNEGAWPGELARLAVHLRGLPSDFEKTTFLRRYTGELLDIGRLDRDTASRYRAIDFDAFDIAEYYPLFRANRLPAHCGITSFFYVKLLHAFGFKAYQYSFGFTGRPYERYIHSVALVDIGGPRARRLIVQDPYLNLTYRDRAGEPMDFYDLLLAMRGKRYQDVVMDAATVNTSLLVPDLSLYEPYLPTDCRTGLREALRRSDGSIRKELPITRDYATLMRSECDDFEKGFVQAMRHHGHDEPFVYAYTLRAADLVGSSDHRRVQERIDAVLR
jgi:hypothetical protein